MLIRTKGLVHSKVIESITVLIALGAIVMYLRILLVRLHLLLRVEGGYTIFVGAFDRLDWFQNCRHCGEELMVVVGSGIGVSEKEVREGTDSYAAPGY